MKIGTKEMFKDFNGNITVTTDILKKDIQAYNDSKTYMLGKLNPFEHYIRNFTNIKYDEIPTLDRMIYDRQIVTKVSIAGIDTDSLKRSINAVVDINKNINKLQEELDENLACKIEYKTFKSVLDKFNKKVSDEIIYKGYVFIPGFKLSVFRIKKINCLNRKKKRINWAESNKLKKDIIANGGLPYQVTERAEDKSILKDNGGIKWYVYFNNMFDYIWYWGKKSSNAPNVAYYKFRPTIYNNTKKGGVLGNVNKLKQLVTSDSELLKNFSE